MALLMPGGKDFPRAAAFSGLVIPGPLKGGSHRRIRRIWVPLSFIFLLLGTVLGFQVALSVQSKITATPRQDPYRLSLSATPSAGSIHVRWDRASPVIQKAQRGVLVITENSKQKSVALDAGYLRNGSVIYRRASDNVRFRLEVFTSENVSVCETISYQPVTAKSNPGESGG